MKPWFALFLLWIGYGCAPSPRPKLTTDIPLNTNVNEPESSEKTVADQLSELNSSIPEPPPPPRFTVQGSEMNVWLVIHGACTRLLFRPDDEMTGRLYMGHPVFRYTLQSDFLILEHPTLSIEHGIAVNLCRMELENGSGPTLGGSPVFDSDEACQAQRTSVPSVVPYIVSPPPPCDRTIDPTCTRRMFWQRRDYGDCFKVAFYPWDNILDEPPPPRRILAFFKEGRQFYWGTFHRDTDHCRLWTVHPAADGPHHGYLESTFVVDGITEHHRTNYELRSKQIHFLGTFIDRIHPDGRVEQIRRNTWHGSYFVLEGKIRDLLSGPWFRTEEYCRKPFLLHSSKPKKSGGAR